jgi:hypothetical protein
MASGGLPATEFERTRTLLNTFFLFPDKNQIEI